jgi:hypothetical protein
MRLLDSELGLSLLAATFTCVCGIFVWTLLEYSLHRFVFHLDEVCTQHSNVQAYTYAHTCDIRMERIVVQHTPFVFLHLMMLKYIMRVMMLKYKTCIIYIYIYIYIYICYLFVQFPGHYLCACMHAYSSIQTDMFVLYPFTVRRSCGCIYVSVRLCMHMHSSQFRIQTSILIRTHVHMCVYVCVRVNMYVCMYTCTQLLLFSGFNMIYKTCVHMCVYVCVRVNMYVCMYVYMHATSFVQWFQYDLQDMHTYICTHSLMQCSWQSIKLLRFLL